MSTRARFAFATLALGSALLGCDEPKHVEAEGNASLQPSTTTIAAKDFDLAAVVALVEREDVRDAESLEALINAEDSSIRVDVDNDGSRDFIAVHEVGEARAEVDVKVELQAEVDGAVAVTGDDGEQVRFELRAIPSSKVDVEVEADRVVELEAETDSVVVATVDIQLNVQKQEVVVQATYAPTMTVVADVEVEHTYVHHVALEHRHDHLVVVGAPFIAWIWIDVRPVYAGHVHLPPGHAKKLGLHWHHEHGHGRGHGPAHVKRHGNGGPNKVHVKAKSHGGGGKVQVKVKGGGGGGKVHSKFKGGGGKGKR